MPNAEIYMNTKMTLKPISPLVTLLWFLIPGVVLSASIHLLLPALLAANIPHFFAFTWTLYLPMGFLIPLSLMVMKREGLTLTRRNIMARFRLHNLSWKAWLVVVAAFLCTMLLEELSRPLNDILASIFPPGTHLPDFMRPGYEFTFPPTEFIGLSLQGRYWIIPYMLVCLVCNIVGEGFMWRGFLLPRMELTFGRWAWLVNGLLWAFIFHCAFPHLYVGVLPTSLIAPFLAQKFKSSLASMTIHGIGNLLMLFIIILPGL